MFVWLPPSLRKAVIAERNPVVAIVVKFDGWTLKNTMQDPEIVKLSRVGTSTKSQPPDAEANPDAEVTPDAVQSTMAE